jgi:phosphatidylglycerophosphate synthase
MPDARPSEPFREARRELHGLTAAREQRVLAWLAVRIAAMLAAGLLYAGASSAPWRLHAVNLCLALNWLGDSLDGTLARHRRRPRPRYGFYLDHVLDAIGAMALVGGLAESGLLHPLLALALLGGYELLMIETYLATHTLGTFRLSHGPFGGTELRLLLGLANLAALAWPSLLLAGRPVPLFDLLAAGALLGTLGIVGVSTLRNLRILARMEPPPAAGEDAGGNRLQSAPITG